MKPLPIIGAPRLTAQHSTAPQTWQALAPSGWSKYQTGDIVAVESNCLAARLQRRFLKPWCKNFHHFLLGDYIVELGDWTILEALGGVWPWSVQGVRVGRLSFYVAAGAKFHVFRPAQVWDCANKKYIALETGGAAVIGESALKLATIFGRDSYDNALFIKVAAGALRCWWKQLIHEHHLHKIWVECLPYGRDSRFVCTELANDSWRLTGYAILPDSVCPMPPVFQEQVDAGRLVEIT